MKERLRDKTRDELTLALNALGIEATMAERGRPGGEDPGYLDESFAGNH